MLNSAVPLTAEMSRIACYIHTNLRVQGFHAVGRVRFPFWIRMYMQPVPFYSTTLGTLQNEQQINYN